MTPPDAPAVSAQTFLAFDFGMKRTGVATGNRLLRSATPQPTIQAEGDARFGPIEKTIREWQPDAIVVGVPFHPDGARKHPPRAPFCAPAAWPLQAAGVRGGRTLQHHRGPGRRRQRCRRGFGLHHS